MLKKDQAVCLRTVSYSESSQIATFFGRENGKFDGIAKGSRRNKSAFDGTIEVFSFGEMVFAPGDTGRLATITEFRQRPLFLHLRRNLFALNCGFFAAELLKALTHEYDRHADLFDVFVNLLSDLQETRDKHTGLGLLILFQLNLLREIGLQPVVDSCSNCRASFDAKWSTTYFSSDANGLICPDCEQAYNDKMRVSKSVAACFSSFRSIGQAPVETLCEMERVMVNHFSAIMHRRPRMASYFMDIDKN